MGQCCGRSSGAGNPEDLNEMPAEPLRPVKVVKGQLVRAPAPLLPVATKADLEYDDNAHENGLDGIALLTRSKLSRTDIQQVYEIQDEVIGMGFCAPTKVAVNVLTGQKVAVKSFNKVQATKDKVSLVRNEAQIAMKLDHPNIVKLLEVFEDDVMVHLVFEYFGGGELYDRLSRKKIFSEAEARRCALQMAAALAYIHSHHVVHRDIKLENFFFSLPEENAHLKLGNFVFAKIWNPKTSRKMDAICGSVAYISPETLLGGYTNSCDIWSFGVVVYYMLVGYPPFFGAEEDVVEKILNAEYTTVGPRWDRVTSVAKDFVSKCLVTNPDDRLSAAEVLGHEWFKSRITSNELVTRCKEAMLISMWSFAKAPQLQRALLTMLAYLLQYQQTAHLRSTFLGMDGSRDGCIRLVDMRMAFCDRDDLSLDQMCSLFHVLDSKKEGEIAFAEFLASQLGSSALPISTEHRQLVLAKLDPEENGFVLQADLREIFGPHMSDQTFANILQPCGIDILNPRIPYSAIEALLTEPVEMPMGMTETSLSSFVPEAKSLLRGSVEDAESPRQALVGPYDSTRDAALPHEKKQKETRERQAELSMEEMETPVFTEEDGAATFTLLPRDSLDLDR